MANTSKRVAFKGPDKIKLINQNDRFQTEKIDKQLSQIIWKAFGAYVAKCLKSSKAVIIPKLGQFSYTTSN